MEAPSAHGHRGRGPWQGLLLAASLSTFWIPPVTAQLTVEPEPANVAEGNDVLLHVYNLLREPLKYDWYKGRDVDSSQLIISYRVDTQNTTPGPMYSSRETIYPNGSLLIRKVTKADTGDYNVLVLYDDFTDGGGKGRFQVLAVLPKPHIISNNSDPVEHEDTVVLTCGPETPDTTFLWSINSQSLPDSDRLQLSKDNRTLTLLRVTRTDTGPYVCETRNPVSARRSDPLSLNVLYGPDTPTIFPSDTYYRAGANLNLSCHATSNPPAHYSWLINGRPQQSTRVLFMPNITERNNGSYTCLAHNKATGLNMTTFKIITVLEPVAPPSIQASNTTVTEHKDLVVLTSLTRDTEISTLWLLNNQCLWLTDRMTLPQGKSSLPISPVRREDAGEYQPEEDTTGLSAGAIAAIVIGVLAGVVLAAALAIVLVCKRTSDKRGLPERRTPAPTPGSARSGHSASSVPLPDTEPAVPIYQELLQPDTNIYCRLNHLAEVAS